VEKSCVAKAKKGKKVKVFPKHGMHGSLWCLKIL